MILSTNQGHIGFLKYFQKKYKWNHDLILKEYVGIAAGAAQPRSVAGAPSLFWFALPPVGGP